MKCKYCSEKIYPKMVQGLVIFLQRNKWYNPSKKYLNAEYNHEFIPHTCFRVNYEIEKKVKKK